MRSKLERELSNRDTNLAIVFCNATKYASKRYWEIEVLIETSDHGRLGVGQSGSMGTVPVYSNNNQETLDGVKGHLAEEIIACINKLPRTMFLFKSSSYGTNPETRQDTYFSRKNLRWERLEPQHWECPNCGVKRDISGYIGFLDYSIGQGAICWECRWPMNLVSWEMPDL